VPFVRSTKLVPTSKNSLNLKEENRRGERQKAERTENEGRTNEGKREKEGGRGGVPKVSYFDRSVFRDEQVGRFEISVNDLTYAMQPIHA